MRAAARVKRTAEIDRQLDAGIPVKRIALAVGLTERSVYSRKQVWLRSKRGEVLEANAGPGARPAVRDDLAEAVAEDAAVLAAWERSLGLPPLPDLELDQLVNIYL